ncbi:MULTISPECIES: hypothetical protein [Amycolatopsis]|uniref:Uncharacterized protein n=2 Tax=Amycolatopsis TaxID=1813 RepID=A0A1I3L0Q5_9PSEU|nr:hypothetical protein [Amycolatopsis sacchari]SFI78247.1 hypothetical protein SAMN05421835_101768 [Amycolatopsis sacchari]
MTVLPIPAEAWSANATDVDHTGTVVGSVSLAAGTRAVAWAATGRPTDLGTLPRHPDSAAPASDDRGTVVGTTHDANGFPHAVGRNRGAIAELPGLATGPGTTGSDAFAVDDSGVVIGISGRVNVLPALGTVGGRTYAGATAVAVAGFAGSPGNGQSHAVLWRCHDSSSQEVVR